MSSNVLVIPDSRPSQQQRQIRLVIGLYIFFLGVLLLAGPAQIVVPFFPASSFAIGVYLYRKAPVMYVSFTWWLLFLCPVLRRIIDYRAGHSTFGPWGITALFVTLISSATLIKDLPKIYKQRNLPFLLSICSMLYALLISLVQNSVNAVVVGFVSWFTPIAFGYHLYANWQNYPIYRKVILRTFLWGTFVMGVYGAVQFLVLPGWDQFWLENLIAGGGENSFGQPNPLEIRVLSTQGSPQSFASVMVAGLMLLFCQKPNFIYIPATALGYLSFLLSMARAAWLSWAIALPMLMLTLRPKFQMRLLITIAVTALLVIPIVSLDQFSEGIGTRIQSLSDSQDDVSFTGRLAGYNQLLGLALSTLIGGGYSFSLNVASDLGIGDGAILPLLFSFGWLGTLPYIVGMLLLMVELFRGGKAQSDPVSNAAKAITVGLLAQIGFNQMLIDVIGITFWGFLGIGLAANKFYAHSGSSK